MLPKFIITNSNEAGRTGELQTVHGKIETPAFVFCGTKGAIKYAWPDTLKKAQTQIILSNTYHLLIYPGSKRVEEIGGLQKMTAWNGPMMTDSGGYQIFSLGYGSVSQELKGIRNNKKSLIKIKEEGAYFKSYRNGEEIFLSPELAMQAQIDFGADFTFVLDECTAFNISKEQTYNSMLRSHRWGKRSADYFEKHKKPHQSVYGIIQGGVYDEYRKESIAFVNDLNCFGIGIGGSLGKNIFDMEKVLQTVQKHANFNKPKHLLGIGTVDEILMAIKYNIDTFDCVYPTRLARHAGALTMFSKPNKRYINLKNQCFEKDLTPIDPTCECTACKQFSKAYLHMLFKNDESLAIMALTEHNITFMNKLMSLIRQAINANLWNDFYNQWY